MPTVIGAIRDRWLQLGGPGSYLGQPVTDELDFSEGGRVSVFEHGAIYWWPDVGAIDMGEMFVHYTGLNCFHDTGGAGSDEPYVVMGIAVPGAPGRSLRSRIYDDVDGRESRPDLIELYRGPPRGLTVTFQLMEHDHGNPEDYRGAMQGVAGAAGAGLAQLIKLIPKVGPILGTAAGPIFDAVKNPVAEALGKLLGLGDDIIGNGTIVLSPKDMVTMAIRPNVSERQINFKVPSQLLLGQGGSYKVYFGGVKTP